MKGRNYQELLPGDERETRIIKSKVREIFTPYRPISTQELFFGRTQEIQRITGSVNTPGQHVILYGERGVGKSSLANIVSVLHEHIYGNSVVTIRCDSNSTFTNLITEIFHKLGINHLPAESSESQKKTFNAKASLIAEIGGAHESEKTTKQTSLVRELYPGPVAELLAPANTLIVIDEFDAIRKKGDRSQFAEVIKHLSDMGAETKIVLVGVARSCADLMTGHPSVQRCLREVKLSKMSSPEIRQLITSNAKKSKLTFEPKLVDTLETLAVGYPYFAQLLGLKLAEESIGNGRSKVVEDDLASAAQRAVDDADETLRHAHAEAIRSHSTPMYNLILFAAAQIEEPEFSAAQLRHEISRVIEKKVQQSELNNCFGRLVSNDGSKVLERVKAGFYRFSDPRMKSFVRIYGNAITG